MANITTMLEKVSKAHDAKIAAVDKRFMEKRAKLYKIATAEFGDKLEDAHGMFAVFPEGWRLSVWKEPKLKELLKKFGLEVTDPIARFKKAARKSKLSKASEEQILAFVATERTTEEIKKHFGGWSSPTFNKYMTPLVKAGKVFATPTRPKRYKKI